MADGRLKASFLGSAGAAIAEADAVLLALALVQAEGDLDLLAKLESEASGKILRSLSATLAGDVRARALASLLPAASVSGATTGCGAVSPDTLGRMLRLVVGYAHDDDDYAAMLAEQAGLRIADPPAPLPALTLSQTRGTTVAVIGAGMSGLLAGIELRRAGIPFVIYERNGAVGGTWLENRYPGCGVDTPSFFYSYSFEPSTRWSAYFAKRAEIARYFEDCADKYGLRDRIVFETDVVSATYDEERGRWNLVLRHASGGISTETVECVVTAVGQLNQPAIPPIPGLDTFGGSVVHTARWPDDLDVTGRNVAMIGTGASGMQVGPAIAPIVKRLKIFQRSPHWVLGNPVYHRAIDAAHQDLLERLPFYANWIRAQMIWSYGDAVYPALTVDPEWPTPEKSLNAVSERYRRHMVRHIMREVGDRPDLVAKTIPSYPPYGKRVLLDNDWFSLLRRPNVELVADRVAEIRTDGLVAGDGTFHAADTIVLATGFEASRMLWPMEIRGRAGASLRDVWGVDDPRAHLGITVPRFPNLFLIYGPNTNLGYGGSAIFHSECQVRYAVGCIRAMIERDWHSMEVRQDVHDAYNRTVDGMHERMVWARPGVSNWYRNAAGRVTTNSPWRLLDYWAMTREPDFTDFVVEQRPPQSRPRRQQDAPTTGNFARSPDRRAVVSG